MPGGRLSRHGSGPPPKGRLRAVDPYGTVGRGRAEQSDRPYSDDESEFLAAMLAYQDRTGNRFPTWTEALAILRSLGWSKGPGRAHRDRSSAPDMK